jgi:LysR family transcriptional regulator, pca operon transcriptional activator
MLAFMPRLMMVGDLLRRTLRVVPLSIPAPDRPAGLVLPRDGELAAAASSFIICLRTYIAEITASGIDAGITDANTNAGRSNKTRSRSQD